MKNFTIKVCGKERGTYESKEVQGYSVKVADFVEAFAHRDPLFPRWNVTEVTSGCVVASGGTKKAAVEKARAILTNVGKDATLAQIAKVISYQKEKAYA